MWSFEAAEERPDEAATIEWRRANTTSPESVAMAKDLKRRGFSFVGPTTVYAFMQAMGLVNDHLDGCYVRAEVEAARAAFVPPARGQA